MQKRQDVDGKDMKSCSKLSKNSMVLHKVALEGRNGDKLLFEIEPSIS